MINRLECGGIKPLLTQQRQKPATTLNCWSQSRKLVGESLLINSSITANSLRQVEDSPREPLLVILHWGGEEEYNSEPNVFWYNFLFVFLLSFYELVSMRGKVEKYPFFSIQLSDVLCMQIML